VWQKPRNVTKFKIVTLWHLEITKCHTFSKTWYKATFTLYVWIGLGTALNLLGSVLTRFLPSFASQIWVSDVTFVTFFGDKKCDASHLSHLWEECDALAHENIFFWLVTFFVTSFPENVTFWHRRYKTFLNGKKCDDSAWTEKCISLPVSDFTHISEAWSGKAIWARTDPYTKQKFRDFSMAKVFSVTQNFKSENFM